MMGRLVTGIVVLAGIFLLPDVIADVLSHPSMKSDTVHPNEAGYGEIAAAVFAELKERGAI